jgi:hypothetical protein
VLALTYTPVLAHFGHWYISLPTFMTPVVLIAIAVKVSERRALRAAREGDAGRLPVAVTEGEGRTTLALSGPVNYLSLLDLEHELGVAVGRDLPIVIDLRSAAPDEDDFAWSITEVVRTVEDADITVLVGSGEAQRDLGKVCKLEGVQVIADADAEAAGAGPDAVAEARPADGGAAAP